MTAVMLESLAQQYGCRIFALGRSPLEQGPAGLSLEEQESWFYEKFMEEHPDKKPTEMKWAFEKAQARWEAAATICLLYTSPSPRDQRGSRMPSSA